MPLPVNIFSDIDQLLRLVSGSKYVKFLSHQG
jgi:hypothetical protein